MAIGLIILLLLGTIVTIGAIVYAISNTTTNTPAAATVTCTAGKYMNNGICTNCPENTYSSNKATSCTKCITGYTSTEGSSKCVSKCTAGSIYNEITKQCDKCPSGKYQILNRCDVCPICLSSVEGSTVCNVITCENCPVGSDRDVTSVTATGHTGCYCLAGKIWNAASDSCIDANCPNYASTDINGNMIPGHNGCYCDAGRIWNSSNNTCEDVNTCPTGASKTSTSTVVPGRADCYCIPNKIWNAESNSCIDPPSCTGGSSTTVSTSPVPGQTGCYCSPGYRWDTFDGKCIESAYGNCPTGSSTSMLDVGDRVPGYIGCYCDAGKIWNASSGTCIQDCPSYSTRNVTTTPVPGHTGCYCLESYAWDDDNTRCVQTLKGCPIKSTPITIDYSRPAGNHTGCYCLDNTNWDATKDACVGAGCPENTATTFGGDLIAGSDKCRCVSHSYWGTTGCTKCPPYSYIGGIGITKIDQNRFGNCACPINNEWDEGQQRCVPECPPDSMKLDSNPLHLDQTSKLGCYCNTYSTWLNGSCQLCQPGASPSYPGMSTDRGTCKCYGSWYNGSCKSCTNAIEQSYTGLGELDTGTGCRCRNSNERLAGDGTCPDCPGSSGTGMTYTGLSHNIYPQCKCPAGQGWDSSYSFCMDYNSDGCPSGSSLTGSGALLENTNCKCNVVNATVIGSSCISCPGNSNVANDGPVVLSGNPRSCRCPMNSRWDEYRQSCSDVADSCDDTPYATSTPGDSPIPGSTCYCRDGYWWNGNECINRSWPAGLM